MKSAARFLVIVFGILVVIAILVIWKKQDRAEALKALKSDFAADVSFFENEFHVGCSHDRLVDLNEFANLLKRVGEPALLDLTGAMNLSSLQGTGKLAGLHTLIAIDCPKLISAEGLELHPTLEDLVFTESAALVDVTALQGLPNLRTLDLSGCKEVADLDVSSLIALENLYLSRCRKLKSLDVSALPQLRQLYLDGCAGLSQLKGLESLNQLTDLDVSNATSLPDLDGVGSLASLIVLDIRNVDLPDFEEIGSLPALRVLRMGGQDAIQTLEPFSGIETLKEIHLEACPNFRSIKGIPESVSQYAGFTHCPRLESLAGIEKAPGVEQLDLTGCENLHEVSAVEGLKNLCQLSFVKCRQVTDVSFVTALPELVIVALGGSGVVPASVEQWKPANEELIYDFEVSE